MTDSDADLAEESSHPSRPRLTAFALVGALLFISVIVFVASLFGAFGEQGPLITGGAMVVLFIAWGAVVKL